VSDWQPIEIGDLGMDNAQMLELVNRMNERWPGKWVLKRRNSYVFQSQLNLPALQAASTQCSQMAASQWMV